MIKCNISRPDKDFPSQYGIVRVGSTLRGLLCTIILHWHVVGVWVYMKNIVKVLVIAFAFALLAVPSFATPKPANHVHVLSTKRYIFYFKVEKELIGGFVEVLDGSQQVVAAARIGSARNVVDFFYLPAGIYTIKIKQGDEEFIFPYVNVQ